MPEALSGNDNTVTESIFSAPVMFLKSFMVKYTSLLVTPLLINSKSFSITAIPGESRALQTNTALSSIVQITIETKG